MDNIHDYAIGEMQKEIDKLREDVDDLIERINKKEGT
jgi:uncharacterized coiled-coil protein SlyX